ncbi:MAG: CdaR family protein [Enterococcus aquimarinus]
MFTKERISNLMYALLSLVFTLILFFSPNSSNITTAIMSPNTLEETIQGVAIQPIYDSEKYFIQGYEPEATVRLSSLNRILLNSEVNQETRSFRVVTDLTGLTEGTHTVPLKVQNLTTGVTATLEPTSITVTIEKLETKTLPVEVMISDDNLAEGYQISTVSVNPKEVEVTTGNESMKEITKVIANLDNLSDVDQNMSKEVTLYAVNEEGEIISAFLSSKKANVTLEIKAPQKEVPLILKQVGEIPAGISHYEMMASQPTAVIIGSPEQLANYSQLSAVIDISSISEKVQQSVTLKVAEGMFVYPQQVNVTITPVLIPTAESTQDSTGESTANSDATSATTSETNTSESTTSEKTDEKPLGLAGAKESVDDPLQETIPSEE